jgi:hypothetical protein
MGICRVVVSHVVGFLPELARAVHDAVQVPRKVASAAKREGFLSLVLTIGGIAILLMSAAQALTPPTDNDVLMYHLQAPFLYLQSGRIFLTPDIWQANGPLLAEMLNAIGLAFGSDTFARVVDLTFSILLALATLGAASRDLGARAGWMAFGILLGIPILPIWGSLGLSDIAWALYSFLAVVTTLRWTIGAGRHWLLLGGVFTGFAVSTKYLGLGTAILLTGWVVVAARRAGWRRIFLDAGAFTLCGVAIAWPWFLKNLVWTGNPVYPFLLGGPDWDPGRVALLMTYLRSFGTGTGIMDILSLPMNLYIRHADFGTTMTSIDVPSPLFLLAVAFPWCLPPAGWLALGPLVLLTVVLWAVGSQQIRFLLPLYPILALLASVTLRRIDSRWQGPGWRIVIPGILLGSVVATVMYQFSYAASVRPWPVLLGLESKASFLERNLYDYSALRYIKEALPGSTRVALLWDGRGYYCGSRCLPDADLARWPRLLEDGGSVGGAMESLRLLGASHLLVDYEELGIRLQRDPESPHMLSVGLLGEALQPPFTREVFRSEKVALYEILPE